MKDQEEKYGRQCSGDNAFKKAARLHQSRFRVEELGITESRDFGNQLIPEDANLGKNFYTDWPGLFDQVQARRDLKDSPLYYDMLRSEHIPFNLFGPLVGEPELAKTVFNPWVSGAINEVKAIRFEYAPKPRHKFLDDRTAFDVYVEYKHIDSIKGAIGIEVKFTERAYRYGITEKTRMEDPDSLYNVLTEDSKLFIPSQKNILRERSYKQLWRNQLLGVAMMDPNKCNLSRFLSIVIYPAGNKHYQQTCSQYQEFIRPECRRDSFFHMTFEDYFGSCELVANTTEQNEWVQYLQKRYIVY